MASFVGHADDPLRSTWLRASSQILPLTRDYEPREFVWNSSLFGNILGYVAFTEEDDVVAATGSQDLAGYVAFTEEDDVVAGTGYVWVTGTVAFTEEDDVVAAAGASGFSATVSFTEEDDVVAATGSSFINVISPASIDAFPVIGPTLETGSVSDEIIVATIDGSSPVVGPLYVAAVDDDPAFQTAVFIRLFDEDGVTPLDDLEQAFEVDWFDEANGTGNGTFTLPMTDTATADLCTPGRLIRCYLYGLEVFTWRIEPPDRDELKPGEEHDENFHFTGSGWASVLDEVRVEPAIPVLEAEPDLSSPFGGRDRVFSFASPDYPNDNWPHAYVHYEYHDLQPFRFQTVETLENIFDDLPSPVNIPYPNSDLYLFGGSERVYWIWANNNFFEEGWGFFRGILIDPPVGSIFTISCSADNLFILYVDGVPIMGENADTLLWIGYKEASFTIKEARWYMFGAAVQNTAGIPGGFNPGGWLMASYFAGNQGEPIGAALLSNENWTAMFSANAWPGWTSGQIMERLLFEGNLRGPLNGAIGYTFSSFSDSHGNPWTVLIDGVYTEFVPTLALRVGSTVLEALIQLHDEGWVNWHMRSGTTLLDMWSYDAPALNSGVVLEVSTDTFQGNLMDLERQPDELLANDLLVAYDDGVTKYVRVRDEASIALHGRREEVWDSGGTSADEARRMGGVEIRKRAIDDEGGAIVVVLQPRDLTETPYFAFNVLDTVACPSLGGGTFDAVVYSIAVSTDEEGVPIFTMELNKRWPSLERDTSKLLRTIGGKTVGSWKGRL